MNPRTFTYRTPDDVRAMVVETLTVGGPHTHTYDVDAIVRDLIAAVQHLDGHYVGIPADPDGYHLTDDSDSLDDLWDEAIHDRFWRIVMRHGTLIGPPATDRERLLAFAARPAWRGPLTDDEKRADREGRAIHDAGHARPDPVFAVGIYADSTPFFLQGWDRAHKEQGCY